MEISFEEKVQKLASLITMELGEEQILFTQGDDVGFSIKKRYAEDVGFSRLVKNNGDIASSCLIRIACRKSDSDVVKLFIDCSLYADSQQGNHFEDDISDAHPESLRKESIQKFSNSRLPFTISSSTTNKFIYNTSTHKFYQEKSGQEVTLREIVDDVYNTHLQSINFCTYYSFHITVWLFSKSFKTLRWLIYNFFIRLLSGRKLNDRTLLSLEIGIGFLTEFKTSDFVPIEPESLETEVVIPFFSGKLNVQKRGLISSIVFLAVISMLFKTSFIINTFQAYKDNAVILASLALSWIIVFNLIVKYIPIIGLHLLNWLIFCDKKIANLFSINGYDFEFYHNSFVKNH